jgi:hypothetical protein
MVAERLAELVGMLMIGDGVLAVLEPEHHMRLWRQGPAAWERIMDPFVKRPGLTRRLGAAEVALGVWLASRQAVPRSSETLLERAGVPKTFAESF